MTTNHLTLEKIGQLAGVSRATVSRVVNNHPNVRTEVRERVLKVIADTGYQPNLAARSLASNRTGVIGLVIPRMVQALFTDPYYPRLIQGISQASNDNNYTLSLFLFHTAAEEQNLASRLVRRGFLDGVIVAASLINDPLLPHLIEAGMPYVLIGKPLQHPDAHYVDVDNLMGAFTAVSHLIRQGRRRIATITGRQDMIAGIQRQQGYRDAMQAQGLPIDESLIINGEFEAETAYKAMQTLLPHQPDAVFAASDTMALSAMRAITEAGRRIPQDIAVVGYDDLPSGQTAVPPLTTIRQPIQRIGALAAATLIDIINQPQEPTRRIVLPSELVIRQSCGFH
jgi:LacI family transcriptional regulator